VGLLLAAMLGLGALSATPGAEAAASTAPWPVVQGTMLLDARTATQFVPRGANFPGFEYACWQGWGYSGDTTGEAALMASWKITTVRIPLNQDCWLGLQGSPAGAGRTKEGYRAAVEAFVGELNAVGIVAILDLHSSAPAGYPAHGQRAMPDAQSRTFWTSVATRFASNPSVMFDLFNEPYSRWNDATSSWAFDLTWQCWRDGGCQAPVEDDYTGTLSGTTYTVVGMATLVADVRAAGATQPIMLGGRDYSNDLRQWLAYRPNDTQLVASWHNYPGQRCSTTACWNAEIAPVAATVPVVAGETGQTDGGNGFLTTFMTWADSHGVGYLPWAWWRVDAAESLTNSRYALVGNDNLPKAPAGTALHNHLAALPPAGPTVSRVSGPDRYATAVAISQHAFTGTAPVVYIATGTNYPDALSAGPAASKQGGPLLLTPPTFLAASVRAEIERLQPSTIVVVGSAAAVSDAVEAQLRALQPNTVRISGSDRYATSRAIVDYAFDSSTEVYVATGRDFPDALSASAAAAHSGSAVVLVDGRASNLDETTAALIGSLHPTTIAMVGGLPAINLETQNALAAIAPAARLAGDSRYSTSVAVAQWGWDTVGTVILATGLTFPDALAASVWAGTLGAPLLIVPGTCVTAPTRTALSDFGVTSVILVGGEPALSPAVFALTPC